MFEAGLRGVHTGLQKPGRVPKTLGAESGANKACMRSFGRWSSTQDSLQKRVVPVSSIGP